MLAPVGGPVLGARAGQITWGTGLILEDIVPGGGCSSDCGDGCAALPVPPREDQGLAAPADPFLSVSPALPVS